MTASHRIGRGRIAWLVLWLGAAPAGADLPVGWEVDVFAGSIVDLAFHDGVIAGATDGGLLLYDVSSQSSATPRFTQIADAGCQGERCLRSNMLTAVDVDDNGWCWVGTRSSGVSALRQDSGGFRYRHFFRSNSPESGLLADSVLALDAWADETVYVATTSGIAQIDLAGNFAEYNEVESRELGTDLPATTIHDVAADSTHVWLASDLGVLRYRRGPDHEVVVLSDSLLSTRVNVIETIDSDVFIGTDDGVYRWHAGDEFWERIRNANGESRDFRVYSLARLRDPDPARDRLLLVAGSDTEVWLFQGFVWGRCSPPTVPLLGPRTFPAVIASGDSVWTSQSDVERRGAFLERFVFSEGCGSWTRFQPNSIPPTAVNFVDLTRDRQQLWVALQSAGVARRSADGTWCAFNSNDPIVAANMSVPEGGAEAFRIDRGGSAWFTNLPGNAQATVDRLDGDPNCEHAGDVWDHIDPGEFGFGGRYWKIEVDGEGNRFFLADENPSSPGGLEVLSPDLTQFVNVRDDLLGGKAVGAIAFLSSSGPWATAYLGIDNQGGDGLVLWRNSNDLFMPTSDNFLKQPLRERSVTAYRDMVYHARHGHLWIGTDAGLIRYDTQDRRVTRFFDEKSDLTELGLLSSGIADLLLDDRDNLWVATANGLNRISVLDTAITQIEVFTTRAKIEELNSKAGEFLYRDETALAPLPAPEVESLAFDDARRLLHIATRAGLATLDVEAFDSGPRIPIEQAVIYPNPVRPLHPDNPLDPTAQIFVDHVTVPATVVIYNLEGQVVAVNRLEEPGAAVWDLKIAVNDPGSTEAQFFKATSGVYLVRIESPTGSTVTPVVVIR